MELKEDPFLEGALLLRGYRNLCRIKFYDGRYRLVYTVSLKSRTVVIERVRRRGTAYLGLRDPG